MLSLFEIISGILSGDVEDTPKKPPQRSRDKYVMVKHNGRETVYRVNQYGELFEDKK